MARAAKGRFPWKRTISWIFVKAIAKSSKSSKYCKGRKVTLHRECCGCAGDLQRFLLGTYENVAKTKGPTVALTDLCVHHKGLSGKDSENEWFPVFSSRLLETSKSSIPASPEKSQCIAGAVDALGIRQDSSRRHGPCLRTGWGNVGKRSYH